MMKVLDWLPKLEPIGMSSACMNLSLILIGLIIGAMLMPSRWSIWTNGFRLSLFCYLLPKILHFATSRSHAFGNLSFDWVFAVWGWHLLARLIDVTLVPLVSPHAPRWIQPTPKELKRIHLELKQNRKTLSEIDQEDLKYSQIPKQWDTLDYPNLLTWSRFLYAIDILTLVRVGTALIFPWQLRSFDWSLPALIKPRSINRFGKAEVNRKTALIHSLLFKLSIIYSYHLLTSSKEEVKTIRQFKFIDQLLLTISAGFIIALSSAPFESLTFDFLIDRKILPTSALAPNFDQPYLSDSIEDFWGRRWHRLVRRHLTRIGSIFPLGRTKFGNVFWAYVVSGIMHSFMLARAHPEPELSKPMSYLKIFFDPGTTLFFSLQGIAMIIERLMIPLKFKRLWLWFSILVSGRWYIDSVLQSAHAIRSY